MIAQGFADAIATLRAALTVRPGVGPADAPLHMPPFDQKAIGLPAIIVQLPTLNSFAGTLGGCYQWEFTTEVLIVSESTVGVTLPGLADAVIDQLTTAGVTVTGSSDTVYQPPDVPAGVPAIEITVE